MGLSSVERGHALGLPDHRIGLPQAAAQLLQDLAVLGIRTHGPVALHAALQRAVGAQLVDTLRAAVARQVGDGPFRELLRRGKSCFSTSSSAADSCPGLHS